MAVKSILTRQEDFTGEIPTEYAASGLWRFNEVKPDSNTRLADSSGHGRDFTVINWSGTTADMIKGKKGYYFRMNISNPTTEKTVLRAVNDGSIFAQLGPALRWAVG